MECCGTNVMSQIKSRGILTAQVEFLFLGQNGSTSSTHKIFRLNPKHLKLRNRVLQTIYFSTIPKKNLSHIPFNEHPWRAQKVSITGAGCLQELCIHVVQSLYWSNKTHSLQSRCLIKPGTSDSERHT